MISLVRGRIVSRTVAGSVGRTSGQEAAATVVVDVGGVGYLVHVPASELSRLPARGDEAVLHTSLQVREDAMTLYGFSDPTARDVFETILSISGVGPKIALAALSVHPSDALVRAIADGDVDALVLVPGVGKKLAQRIVLELKEKLGGLAVDTPIVSGGPEDAARSEARLALIELGYTPAEAHAALAGINGDGDAADLVRAALRTLAEAGSR
jgi:holliday junction DNA helicase RuvA